ncbi:MAG TPA: hypothetical protein VFW37_13275 [Alphaproteobacteria bacterium]|nr:hypothetical protein [Alphaproteobacteria bacterium]
MSSAYEISGKHMQAALQEGRTAKIPDDVLARAFLERVLEIYRQGRSLADIASELNFHIDNLDPDGDHEFMRP